MAPEPPAIFLHIGAMKTGTSYLQRLMVDNRAALLEQGVLVAGEGGWGEQVLAVREVLGMRRDAEIRERTDGAWDRLSKHMLTYEGRAALVSMEFLSYASPKVAERVVASLQPAEVHVILTVRDAARVIPAQWQETTQNRGTTSWPRYVAEILAGPDRSSASWRSFQRALDIPRMLAAWGQSVPAERLHVVLVPAGGAEPTLLWQRFASVLGVDPASCAPPTGQRNPSLGYASADLMRRVNRRLRRFPQYAYMKTMKAYLSKQVLATRTGEPKVTMSRALAEFALEWNRSMSEAIAAAGANVVGDLSDLDVTPSTEEELAPPPTAALLGAAADAANALQRLIRGRSRKVEAELRMASDEPATAANPAAAPVVPLARGPRKRFTATSWDHRDDPVEAAVLEIANLAREAIGLRHKRREIKGLPVGRGRDLRKRSLPKRIARRAKREVVDRVRRWRS
ncbi:MAG: hypothetical protein ACR2KL_03520 [Nocardioidaceae bacterium]